MQAPYRRMARGKNADLPQLLRSGPFDEVDTPPNRLRWDPLPIPSTPTDFIDGLVTIAGSGDPAAQAGIAVHVYCANRSMKDRYFSNADGEMLFVPQLGSLRISSELGILGINPGEIAVIPRGLRFNIGVQGPSRGYLCENYGAHFRLPELGPIGAQGLAQKRDFQAPVAAYEGRGGKCELVQKFLGKLWSAEARHSPLDVVAWHGNGVPYKYDLARFMAVNTVTFDHAVPPRSSPCSPRPRASRGWRTATSSSSRRAGWSPSTASARPGFTAT